MVLAIPGLGLLARKGWVRILAIVVAVLNLANVPIGTVVGLYVLWVLLQEEAGAYFAPRNTPAAPPAGDS